MNRDFVEMLSALRDAGADDLIVGVPTGRVAYNSSRYHADWPNDSSTSIASALSRVPR